MLACDREIFDWNDAMRSLEAKLGILAAALMLSGCRRNALHTWSGVDPARIIRTALSCLKRSNLIDIDVRARSAT